MISLKNMCAGYGKKQVLSDITVDFEKGKITSIIGPNGCGKSTLLKTISGIISLQSGDIKILEKSLSDMPPKESAKFIAYLAQGKSVPDMTVYQMVLHGRFPHLSYPRRYKKQDKEFALSAMEKMDILNLADSKMSLLSGGMQQKAYIAMALCQNTDYILMDEPTAYLDISNRLQLMDMLKKLSDNTKGIVTVLHDITLAMRYSDKVVVIKDGKIVISSTPDEVFNSNIIYDVFNVNLKRTQTENGYVYYYE